MPDRNTIFGRRQNFYQLHCIDMNSHTFCFSPWVGLRKERWNKSWNECKVFPLVAGATCSWSLVQWHLISKVHTMEPHVSKFGHVLHCKLPASFHPLPSYFPHASSWKARRPIRRPQQEVKYNGDVLSGEKEKYFRMKQVRVLNDFCHLLLS